jgi:flavin reductase (DIM6/NTAB) family NADH-FMN oxidoreductase RutF
MHLTFNDIQSSDRKFRINLINSITGIKPANLIGTVSEDGINNLAIISSVVHLGSHPPLIGFIMRPKHQVKRDTFENIVTTENFTINQVSTKMIKRAHYTSAKFDETSSEFEECNFSSEFLDGFSAPYVKESKLKIGLQHLESIPIKANKTLMIVGQVEHLYIDDNFIDPKGYINLESMNSAGIGGLNSYYELNKVAEYPYARIGEIPDFKHEKTASSI